MAVWKIRNVKGRGSPLEMVRKSRRLSGSVRDHDIPHMAEAITAIVDGLHEPMAIFGDYDCDGICGALILKRALERAGAKVEVRLPTRDEGYGIKPYHVQELHEKGIKTIVTVDTGVTAIDVAEVAKDLGIKFIVTDHHEPKDELPDCIVVNAKLKKEGFRDYSGAGVAHILCERLLKFLGLEPDEDSIVLASLATVVDMVPIVGPNFAMAREGLLKARKRQSVGLEALMEVSRVKELNGRAFGWQLGPRINAAGRVGDPMLAFRLLETQDRDEAGDLARELEKMNRARQGMISNSVEKCMSEFDGSMFPVFTCDCPAGVVGLVAGRVARNVRRPTIVGRAEDGVVFASGRSVGGFSLLEALNEAQSRYNAIDNFGGHSAACGLEVELERLPSLRQALDKIAKERLTIEDTTDWVDVDGVLREVPSLSEIEELDELEPHGQDNPEPIFLISGRADRVRRGDNWQLASTGGIKYFLDPKVELVGGQDIHLAMTLYINEYNGRREVMGRVKDVKETLLSRGKLLRGFEAWRSGEKVSGIQEKVFRELGFTRTGEVTKTNLICSKTFREFGAL